MRSDLIASDGSSTSQCAAGSRTYSLFGRLVVRSILRRSGRAVRSARTASTCVSGNWNCRGPANSLRIRKPPGRSAPRIASRSARTWWSDMFMRTTAKAPPGSVNQSRSIGANVAPARPASAAARRPRSRDACDASNAASADHKPRLPALISSPAAPQPRLAHAPPFAIPVRAMRPSSQFMSGSPETRVWKNSRKTNGESSQPSGFPPARRDAASSHSFTTRLSALPSFGPRAARPAPSGSLTVVRASLGHEPRECMSPRPSSPDRVQPFRDPARRVVPRPARRHLGRGPPALRGGLLAVLEDVAEQVGEMLGIGVGPSDALVIRGARVGGEEAADPQRVRDPLVDELRVRAPVRRDGRQPAGHRLHERHVPALAASGRHVAIRGSVERAELVIRELPVVQKRDAPAARRQAESLDLRPDVRGPVDVDDLADEDRGVLPAKGLVEDLQEHIRALALDPFEVRQENEVARGVVDAPDPGVEVVDVHAERHDVDRLLQPRCEEPVPVEPGRHPHLVHLVRLPHPLLGKAVHLEHRVADPVAALVAVKDVPLPVDDGYARLPPAPAPGDRVQEVIARVVVLARGEGRAGAVDVRIRDADALRVAYTYVYGPG